MDADLDWRRCGGTRRHYWAAGVLYQESDEGERMSETMNSRIFARKWLEKKGFFDKDSDYGGVLGKAAMEIVELIANQGHTGTSGPWLVDIIAALYKAYDDPNDPIWQEYWQSDEGKKLIASVNGASE